MHFQPKKIRISFALFVIATLLLSSVLPHFLTKAQAGTLTSSKVTISDSRAGNANTTYDFAFTTTVTTAIKQIDINICTTPTGTCTAPTGLDTGTPTLASDNIAGTGRTTTKISAANNTIRVVVTTPASQATQAVTMQFTGVTNSSTADASNYARVVTYSDTGTTEIDSGELGFAILTSTSIAITASVGSTFTFTVSPATTGSVNGQAIDVAGTTANLIPFGVLSDGTPKIAAHDLSVTTNANNGYSITVKALADPPLSDSTNNIDKFSGTNASPSTWSSPAGGTANTNTGYFGYTTNDATLGTGTADRFTSSGGNKWAGPTTSPLEVAYSAAQVGNGETTRIGWQAEINETQPPGDYTGTVILVATPTY